MTRRRMLRPYRVPTLLSLLVGGSLAFAEPEFTDIALNVDVDGDGFIRCDEGCDLRVSTLGSSNGLFRGPANQPAIAWTGDRTALAWWQESVHDKGLFLSLRGDAGEPILPETRVDMPESSGPAVSPSIVWNGIDLAIAWIRRFRVAFARFTPDGERIGDVFEIGNPEEEETEAPSLVWGGSEYGVFWRNYLRNPLAPHLAFARLDAFGQQTGDVVTLGRIASTGRIASVWTGVEYVAAWAGGDGLGSEIFLTRVDGFGTQVGSDLQLTQSPGLTRAPSLVWTGQVLVLAWEDFRDGLSQVYLARFRADGARLTPDLRISDPAFPAASPALAWTGGQVVASWEEYPRLQPELILAYPMATEPRRATVLRLGDDHFSSTLPGIAWTGSDPALTWVDSRDLEPMKRDGGEVYFRRIVPLDCDDGDTGTWPGAPEVCDGQDNDCDGAADEGCLRRRGRR